MIEQVMLCGFLIKIQLCKPDGLCAKQRRSTSPPHIIKWHISARAVKHLRGRRSNAWIPVSGQGRFIWCAQPVSAHLRQVLSTDARCHEHGMANISSDGMLFDAELSK